MDSLMKVIDNYQAAPSNEQIDKGLFLQYMNKLPIWDYSAVTREAYLAFNDSDKRAKISSYYYDMKSRSSSGKIHFYFFLENVCACWFH